MRSTTIRLLAATALVTAFAACSDDETATTSTTTSTSTTSTVQPSSSAPATSAPSTTAPATSAPSTNAPATDTTTTTAPADVDVRVYFLSGERLAIRNRDVAGPAVLHAALDELLAGPPTDLITAIPEGTELRGVDLDDGTATVDLTGEFASGGGTLSMTARVAQVVFTATQFDNVDEVVFWLDGEPIDALGGEGLIMEDPWSRDDVAREFTGGVLVDRPLPGDRVTSPFVVTGEADVYEGQFPIEIRRGDEVLAVIAPVRGGAWGDWQDFSVTVEVDAAPGPIELVAYDEGGCGTGPECPPIVETVVPLVLER